MDPIDSGAAYIFKYIQFSDKWQETEKLSPLGDLPNDDFGHSVAISGNWAIVGAIGKDVNKGAAYIYQLTGGTWARKEKLQPSDLEEGDNFGHSVAISGNWAIVGAIGQNNGKGAVYVYHLENGTWTEKPKLKVSNLEHKDNFGHSVAISSGDWAIVGAIGDNGGKGAAYMYQLTDGKWAKKEKLHPSDLEHGDNFGHSVAISEGGYKTINVIVGAVGQNSHTGAAYMYWLQDEKWEYRQALPASNLEQGDYFGHSVAISESGHDVIVGAVGQNSNTGAAYVFNQDKVFVVNPQHLNISGVFLTGNNYTQARIFANGVMQARLILEYDYEYTPEYFPGATQGEIEEVVIPKVNSYLQDPKNLRIYLQGDENQDITAKGWKRESESNGYLHDLDKPSKNPQAEELSRTRAIQDELKSDRIYSEYAFYITPPENDSYLYDMLVKLVHKTSPNNPIAVTLETQKFDVSKEDLEVKTISEQTYPFGRNNMTLRALTYKTSRFGPATLNHIDEDDYLGMVLDSNKNVCFLNLSYYKDLYNFTFSGILFYPETDSSNGYPLRVAERNKYYPKNDLRFFNINKDESYTLSSTIITLDDEPWERSEEFRREEIEMAHQLGIPMVTGENSFQLKSDYSDDPVTIPLQLKRALKVHDNCGNAIMVKSLWKPLEYTDSDNIWHPAFEIIDAYPNVN